MGICATKPNEQKKLYNERDHDQIISLTPLPALNLPIPPYTQLFFLRCLFAFSLSLSLSLTDSLESPLNLVMKSKLLDFLCCDEDRMMVSSYVGMRCKLCVNND